MGYIISPWGPKELDMTERLHFFFFLTWEAQLSPPATTTELPGHNQRAHAPQQCPTMQQRSQVLQLRLDAAKYIKLIYFKK